MNAAKRADELTIEAIAIAWLSLGNRVADRGDPAHVTVLAPMICRGDAGAPISTPVLSYARGTS